MGFMKNIIHKRIGSIIKQKLGRELSVIEAVPVVIRNIGMGNITKHEGDGWFVKTNEGVLFVDNYVAIDLEPVNEIYEIGDEIQLVLHGRTTVKIHPKHETAKKVVLSTQLSK
jgi:hypothetical protein